jgi:hypothetical protein
MEENDLPESNPIFKQQQIIYQQPTTNNQQLHRCFLKKQVGKLRIDYRKVGAVVEVNFRK